MAANSRSIEHFDKLVEMHSEAEIPSRSERLRIEGKIKPGPKSVQRQQKIRRHELQENTSMIVRTARNGMLCPVLQRDRELGYNFLLDCGIAASDWNSGRPARYGGLPPPTFIGGLPDLATDARSRHNREMLGGFHVERRNGKDLNGIKNNVDKPRPEKDTEQCARAKPIRRCKITRRFY